MIGSQLGNYELLEEIGSGGMGRVYRAHQKALDRIVAVKVLLPQFANDQVFVERFLREARAMAALDHPGIVTIYDVGESQDTYYFAMQFLSGRTLEEVLAKDEAMSWSEALNVTRHMAEALAYAHAEGILHRDVKSGNIFLTDDGRVVLTDFGIAWAASQTRLTMANTSVGSPAYMAPEQVEGKQLDRRADLYSLGVVLFEMLTGRVPFQGDSTVSVAYQHVRTPVPSPCEHNPAVPAALDALTRRLMSKKADDRYFAASDLIEDLDRISSGASTIAPAMKRSRRRLALGVGIAATVLALAVVVAVLVRPDWRGNLWEAAGRGAEPAVAATQPGGEPSVGTQSSSVEPEEPLVMDGEEQSMAASAESTETDGTDSRVAAFAVEDDPLRHFRITSQPEGATVIVNGRKLPESTPAEVDLEPATSYSVSLRLHGHEPAGWTFELDDLSDAQTSSGALHFPLQRSIPPAILSVATTFPVRLEIEGKTYDSPITDLTLEPGSYQVKLEAASVFYSETRQVDLASGASRLLDLPPLTTVTVAATPSRCRIQIDGRDAGYVPVQVQITEGSHDFQFDWESIGKSVTLTRAITSETDRVFAAAPRP